MVIPQGPILCQSHATACYYAAEMSLVHLSIQPFLTASLMSIDNLGFLKGTLRKHPLKLPPDTFLLILQQSCITHSPEALLKFELYYTGLDTA